MAAQYARNLIEEYKQAVLQNPQLVTQLEVGFRVASYLVAGRFHDSQLLSELFYTASNLVVMLNDAILRKGSTLIHKDLLQNLNQKRLMQVITVLEYVEVFVELTAQRLWGQTGRWVAITAIQVVKAAARYLLLTYFKAGIQPVPPITPLNRRLLVQEAQQQQEQQEETAGAEEPRNGFQVPFTVTLKRSGKTMRTLAMTPQLSHRNWRLPGMGKLDAPTTRENFSPTPLNQQRMLGETIHIFKPLLHLSSLYQFGLSSWIPWLLSCGLDITSLCLMGDPKDLNPNEQGEMRRRCVMLLLYMLRSPFYDRYSQARIIMLLKLMADNIPGVSLLMRPLLDYLPQWQKVYFYIWST